MMFDLQFKVEAAKEMDDNHPQWDFSEDEGAKNTKAEDEEFATESESDEEQIFVVVVVVVIHILISY